MRLFFFPRSLQLLNREVRQLRPARDEVFNVNRHLDDSYTKRCTICRLIGIICDESTQDNIVISIYSSCKIACGRNKEQQQQKKNGGKNRD